MKKFFALVIIIFIAVYPVSFCASATIYYKDGNVFHMPGHMRKYTELKDYNYAWADEIVIRDGSSSVLPLTMHPIAEYPYSHTLEEYIEEFNDYTSLFYISDKVLETTFNDIIEKYYYLLLASGKIPEELSDMRDYNESRGIVYPYPENQYTDIYSVVVYACLKTDFYSVIAQEPIRIVRGTTLEGAVVALLGGICSYEAPSSVETLEDFCVLFVKDKIIEDKHIPISNSPSEAEVLYWIRLLGAEKGGYAVNKSKPFADVSQEEYDYVTYAYYAAILTGKYEVPISPQLLRDAINSNDKNAIATLVLKSMLDRVSVHYKSDESIASLFDKALGEGYFDLEDEFYSDIYDYIITVDEAFDSIWMTEFLLAKEFGNEKSDVSVYINGSKVTDVLSHKVSLNRNDPHDKVIVEIFYNDLAMSKTTN